MTSQLLTEEITSTFCPLPTSYSWASTESPEINWASVQPLRQMHLPFSSGRQRQADLAEAEKELQLAAPSVRFRLKLHTPPLPDGS